VAIREEVRSKPGVVIEPDNFEISPDEVVRVKVAMVATTADVISKNLVVVIDGEEEKKQVVEVTATCVQQQLSIVFDEGGGQKSSLNFGTLYMGERREYPAYLVNNGPQPVPFKFGFLQGLRNLDENYEDEKNTFTSPAEVGKELTDRVLTTEPLSGTVGPYQQIPINFICRTKKHEKKGGFSDSVDNDGTGGPPGSAISGARSQGTNASGALKSATTAADKSKYMVKPQDYASLAIVRFDED